MQNNTGLLAGLLGLLFLTYSFINKFYVMAAGYSENEKNVDIYFWIGCMCGLLFMLF